mmetsp:Transcript_16226/g.53964  ORF Transcript_16226/g.53964 Transcript_16226/m.53964 type:complete len:265 (+) Transcript_16226:301-1095(+)
MSRAASHLPSMNLGLSDSDFSDSDFLESPAVVASRSGRGADIDGRFLALGGTSAAAPAKPERRDDEQSDDEYEWGRRGGRRVGWRRYPLPLPRGLKVMRALVQACRRARADIEPRQQRTDLDVVWHLVIAHARRAVKAWQVPNGEHLLQGRVARTVNVVGVHLESPSRKRHSVVGKMEVRHQSEAAEISLRGAGQLLCLTNYGDIWRLVSGAVKRPIGGVRSEVVARQATRHRCELVVPHVDASAAIGVQSCHVKNVDGVGPQE